MSLIKISLSAGSIAALTESISNAISSQLKHLERLIIMSADALATQIDAVTTQLTKVVTEVQTASAVQASAIATLQAEIAALQAGGVVITPAVQAAMANLQTVANTLDALNPDAPPAV